MDTIDTLDALVQRAQSTHDTARGTLARIASTSPTYIVQCAQGWLKVSPIYHGTKFLANHVHLEVDRHDYGHEEDWLKMYIDPDRNQNERRTYVCVPLDVVETLVLRRGGLQ